VLNDKGVVMTLKSIVRHTLPSKFDHAEFGTICQANYDDERFELFVQLAANDTEEALWEPISSLLESAFLEVLQNEEFLKELLNLVATTENKSFAAMAAILAKLNID
jgi:hypothetical protein